MITTKPTTVDEYIAGFPKETQVLLEKVRQTIKNTAPEAEEGISYGMAGYRYKGKYLVYFSGFKNHIGFYPVPQGIEAFKTELSPYKTGKGSVQFPVDQPIPYSLIEKIVKFRMKQNEEDYLKKVKS